MKKLIKNNVYWVGKVDWELQKFHGDDYSTHNGSSYNSYLIREEKNVLIDLLHQMPKQGIVLDVLRSSKRDLGIDC